MNGWIKEDRIYGAGVCPGGQEDKIKRYAFASGAQDDGEANEDPNGDGEATLKSCIFQCKKKTGLFSTKPCAAKNGQNLEIEVYLKEFIKEPGVLTEMGQRPDRSCKKNKDIQKEAIKLCRKGVKSNYGVYEHGNQVADGDEKCNKVE